MIRIWVVILENLLNQLSRLRQVHMLDFQHATTPDELDTGLLIFLQRSDSAEHDGTMVPLEPLAHPFWEHLS